MYTLGILFDGFFRSELKYARFVIIAVKKIKEVANTKMTPKKLNCSLKKLGLKLEKLEWGAISNPVKINEIKMINCTAVRNIKVLIAIVWVRKTTIDINNIEIIAIRRIIGVVNGKSKRDWITIAKACEENDSDAILAIHKKIPIM